MAIFGKTSILELYKITIQEILDKLKKLFEKNVKNVLTTNFLNILIMISLENLGATSEIGAKEKIQIYFKVKF